MIKELMENLFVILNNAINYIGRILAFCIIVLTAPFWIIPYLMFHSNDILGN